MRDGGGEGCQKLFLIYGETEKLSAQSSFVLVMLSSLNAHFDHFLSPPIHEF